VMQLTFDERVELHRVDATNNFGTITVSDLESPRPRNAGLSHRINASF